MENYSYGSYADSGDSSPRSREIKFDSVPPAPPWDNQKNYRAKFMCSYGGKILPRPHDNSLCYVGGDTKILAVDRAVKLSAMIAKLSALFGGDDVSFKYQLPGEDLDALISVTTDDDLDLMMCEHDRLYRSAAKPARMRIFLFPAYPLRPPGFPADVDRDVFVEALNLGPILPDSNAVDFLFGRDKYVAPSAPPEAARVAGMYPGDHYYAAVDTAGKALREKIPAVQIPVSAGYWPVSSGGFPAAVASSGHPVYVIPASAAAAIQPPLAPAYTAAYGAIPSTLPLPISAAMLPSKLLPAAVSVAPPTVPPLSAAAALPYIPPPPPLPAYSASAPPIVVPPPKMAAAAYPQVAAAKGSGGFAVAATERVPYGPVPYDGTTPRHVYYATPGAGVAAPLPQSFAPAAAVRGGAGIGMEGKMVIAKVPQGPV